MEGIGEKPVREARRRARDYGIRIGTLPPGEHNAITDVPGVRVGHATVTRDEPSIARTGVTAILHDGGLVPDCGYFGGFHAFNGYGEMTGTHWLAESGALTLPVCLTSSYSLGLVRDTLIGARFEGKCAARPVQPIVAETNDGVLSDGSRPAITAAHVFEAIESAAGGMVAEGNVGGGTGMICHGFKGGIGTASRIVSGPAGAFTVGVLVQANYGRREQLVVAGCPVGWLWGDGSGGAAEEPAAEGSIIIVIATDAPLLPQQCGRLARRAAVGLGRVGGIGANGSGDLFLAFSVANALPLKPSGVVAGLSMLPNAMLTPLFSGVAEATEEAILNALAAASTMSGKDGVIVEALDFERVRRITAQWHARPLDNFQS